MWDDLEQADLDYRRLADRRGVSLAHGERRNAVGRTIFEGMGYAGGMEHNFFFVAGSAIEDTNPLEPRLTTFHHAYSIGDRTGRNPVSGSASWAGVMAGYTGDGKTIAGDADLTADFAASNLDLEFTNMREHGGTARTPDMRWDNVPVRDGSFEAPGLHGHFYGTDHAEAGGVFNRNRITGAFGAARSGAVPTAGPPTDGGTGGGRPTARPTPEPQGTTLEGAGAARQSGTAEYSETRIGTRFPGTFSGTRPVYDLDGWGLWARQGTTTLFRAFIREASNDVLSPDFSAIDEWLLRVEGTKTGTNPVIGSAVWAGEVRAYDAHPDTFGAPVTGDARIEASLDAAATIDVDFTNLTVGRASIGWHNIRLTDGGFHHRSGVNEIEGAFYGAGHEGVAGTFKSDRLDGVFGAKRQ